MPHIPRWANVVFLTSQISKVNSINLRGCAVKEMVTATSTATDGGSSSSGSYSMNGRRDQCEVASDGRTGMCATAQGRKKIVFMGPGGYACCA